MATETVKITKKDNYNTLYDLVSEAGLDAETTERLHSFIDHELELMHQRAEKSKKYQKEHKAASDELSAKIWDTVTGAAEPMSVADIVKAIDGATPQKVVYRLSKYCNDNQIQKETRTFKGDNGTKRVTYYFIASESAAE